MRVLVLAVVLAAAGLADAQPGAAPAVSARPVAAADADAERLFREVMSPFCPGLTLADCPSPNAFTLRNEIRARLERGEPREAIVDQLVAQYGTEILSDPSGTPIGSVVWGVPIVLSAVAALALAFFLRRATHTHHEEPALAVAGPPGLHERLEEELAQLD
jgi:cytochrome c-type biogenesis protein CcmH